MTVRKHLQIQKRYEEGEIEVGAAAVSCGGAALSSSGSGVCVGMEGGIEACTATARCGGATLSSSRFGSCAGTEGEIGGGGAGGCCGSVSPSPSPSMHSISNVGHHEATDNLLLENEAISLWSIRKKNH